MDTIDHKEALNSAYSEYIQKAEELLEQYFPGMFMVDTLTMYEIRICCVEDDMRDEGFGYCLKLREEDDDMVLMLVREAINKTDVYADYLDKTDLHKEILYNERYVSLLKAGHLFFDAILHIICEYRFAYIVCMASWKYSKYLPTERPEGHWACGYMSSAIK